MGTVLVLKYGGTWVLLNPQSPPGEAGVPPMGKVFLLRNENLLSRATGSDDGGYGAGGNANCPNYIHRDSPEPFHGGSA